METGINDTETLIDYLTNIDNINQQLYEQANNNADNVI
jgi:hypothetical protein